MIWRSVQSPAQTSSTEDDSRKLRNGHLFRTGTRVLGSETVRTSDTHATSGKSGKGNWTERCTRILTVIAT